MFRPIATATVLAGTLDILSAFVWSDAVVAVLRTVASGPLGDDMAASSAGAPLGLLVHFAIMAAMVTAFMLAAKRVPALTQRWIVAGLFYGLALWIVMYWIVMPLRWDSYRTPSDVLPILQQLISHCLLTGLPIAWVAARRPPLGLRRL